LLAWQRLRSSPHEREIRDAYDFARNGNRHIDWWNRYSIVCRVGAAHLVGNAACGLPAPYCAIVGEANRYTLRHIPGRWRDGHTGLWPKRDAIAAEL
jgi:hypothetical protein